MPILPALVLLPPLALLAGALLASRPVELPRGRLVGLLALAPAAALAGALAMAVVTWRSGEPLRLVLVPWSGLGFRTDPALHVDFVAAACEILLAVLALAVVVRGQASGEPRTIAGPLLVTAASSLFVAAASEPLGLMLTWLALDLALLASGGGGLREWLLGLFGLSMALLGLVNFTAGGAPGNAVVTDIGAVGRWWLLGAAAVRMGLYPVWWSLPRSGDRPWRSLGTRLAPAVAGAYLVLLVTEGTRPFEGLAGLTLAPAVLATAAGAALAFLAVHRGESIDWLGTHAAGLFVVAALLGGPVGRAIALLLLADLALGGIALYAGEGMATSRATHLGRLVAAASLLGVPPTLGFAARWLLYRELLVGRSIAALAFVVAATILSAMALHQHLRVSPPEGRRDGLVDGLSAAAAGAVLVLGVALPIAGPLLEALGAQRGPAPLLDLWAMVSNPLTAASGLVLIGLLAVPPVLGIAVERSPGAVLATRRRTVRRALELTRVLEQGARAIAYVGGRVHRATGLLESQRAMAWTLAAAALTGTAMLSGPSGPDFAPPSIGSALAFVAAAALASLLVFGTTRLAPLAALVGAYGLVGVTLVATGGLALTALLSVLGGFLVVAILLVGVVQEQAGPDDDVRAALLGPIGDDTGGRWRTTAMALVVALLVCSGLHPTTTADILPAAALRISAALVAGGVLTSVVARDPLRLCGGVLLALAGFGLTYGHLDEGLLITGALAAFQLLFALVASYHIGLASEELPAP